MTDKQIKTAIIYGEKPKFLTYEETHKYLAYEALWEEMKSQFINDEDIVPVIPGQS